MKKLYHYCSLDSLYKIISNNSLRLSDVRKSNDKNEIILLFNEYVKAHDNFMSKWNVKEQINNTTYFSISFSKLYDNDYLWRTYADEGVCIEFDREKIEEMFDSIRLGRPKDFDKTIPNACRFIKIKEIEYAKKDELKKMILDYEEDHKEESSFGYVLFDSPFVKDKYYEKEGELRALAMVTSDYDIVDSLEYVDSSNQLKEVIPFEMCNNKFNNNVLCFRVKLLEDTIKSITISRNCKESRDDIAKTVGSLGARNIIIKYSKYHNDYNEDDKGLFI